MPQDWKLDKYNLMQFFKLKWSYCNYGFFYSMNILIVLPNNAMGGAKQYLNMITTYLSITAVHVFFLQDTDTCVVSSKVEGIPKYTFANDVAKS